MNYFLELKLWDEGGVILVRPEAVLVIERPSDHGYDIVRTRVKSYLVERGQYHVNKLINHTGHAGLKVLNQ